MCNNPSPSGNGDPCSGSASEVRQCFSKPCIVKSHEVAHFMEKSSLLYSTNGRPSRLLHMYLRFLPLTPFGVLIHRYENNCRELSCNYVKLSLHNGKVVLVSQISGCTMGLVHEDKIEIGEWHVVFAVICGSRGILRVNNGLHKATTFSCIPTSYNLDHIMKVGEVFQGQIQEIIINFESILLSIPKDKHDRKHKIVPSNIINVQYSLGDDEEAFISVGLTESVTVPCPKDMESWQITMAIKVENINGVVTIIPDDLSNKYILLLLEEGRVKLRFHQGATHVATESTEHISIGEWFEVMLVQDGKKLYMQINGNEKRYVPLISERMITVATSIFIGAIRDEIREKICPKCADIPQMSFTLGHLNIDGNQIDLLSLPVLETTSKSYISRTISLSDYYEEIPLLIGQELELSCFYDKIPREKGYLAPSKRTYVVWLLMDKLLQSYGNREDVENFYSCHIHRYKNKSYTTLDRASFTFGITVIDKNTESKNLFWKEWCFICGIIFVCFMFIVLWTILEIIQEIKNGHGFYRLPKIFNDDPTTILNFVHSKDGITLLGSQEAANDVASGIIDDN
ncbi:uncharacterized protein LOC143258787 isoform X2 [Megalopta genalis]|uniref:uncharacterized protein LOC143258787 isoform X2 n=1 Tax=Megalopta genalis TaxID=115081 RepID=UPI003FD55F90